MVGEAFRCKIFIDKQNCTPYTSIAQKQCFIQLFCEVKAYMQHSLSQGQGYPQLGRYYYLDCVGNIGLLFIPFGDYQWGVAIDTNKAEQGLLLNVVLPTIISAFEKVVIP